MDRWWADPESARSVALALGPDDEPQMLAGAAVYVLRGIAREAMLGESVQRTPNLARALERVGDDDLIGPICKAFDDASGIEGYGAARVAAIKREADAGARMLVSSMVGAKVPVFVAIRKAAEFYPLPVSRAALVAKRIGRPDADGELMVRMSDAEVSRWASELAAAEASCSVAKSLQQDDFFVTRGGRRTKRTVMRDDGGRFASQGSGGDSQFAGYFERIKGLRQQKTAQAAGRQGRQDPRAGELVRRAQQAEQAKAAQQEQEQEDRSAQEARQQRLQRLNRLGRMGGIGARAEAALAAELEQAGLERFDAVGSAGAAARNMNEAREYNLAEADRARAAAVAEAKAAGKKEKKARAKVRLGEQLKELSDEQAKNAARGVKEAQDTRSASEVREDSADAFNRMKVWTRDDPVAGMFDVELSSAGSVSLIRDAFLPLMVVLRGDPSVGDARHGFKDRDQKINPLDALTVLTGLDRGDLAKRGWETTSGSGSHRTLALTNEREDSEVVQKAAFVAKSSNDLIANGSRSETAMSLANFYKEAIKKERAAGEMEGPASRLIFDAAYESVLNRRGLASAAGDEAQAKSMDRFVKVLQREKDWEPGEAMELREYNDVRVSPDYIGEIMAEAIGAEHDLAAFNQRAALAYSMMTLNDLAVRVLEDGTAATTTKSDQLVDELTRSVVVAAMASRSVVGLSGGTPTDSFQRVHSIEFDRSDGRGFSVTFDETSTSAAEEVAKHIDDLLGSNSIVSIKVVSRTYPASVGVGRDHGASGQISRKRLLAKAFSRGSDVERRVNFPIVPEGFAPPRAVASGEMNLDVLAGKYREALEAQQNNPTFDPFTGKVLEAADG